MKSTVPFWISENVQDPRITKNFHEERHQTKGFTVKWKKTTSSNATGYQVRYSTKASMAGAKTKTIKGWKTTSKKITKLKAKKKYYVQVRTYKKASGKPMYSAWSARKTVKTK